MTACFAPERLPRPFDPAAATQLLWDTYSPHHVWIPFACVGVVAAFGLYIFGRMARRWSDMNA